MACKITYNAQNKITDVKNAQGKPSELFASLAQNPHLEVEKALEIYKNVYSDKFKGIEKPLTYKNSKGAEYNTFAEAIKDTKEGDIEAYSAGNLMFSVDSSINPTTYNGFLNSMISQDLIEGETLFDNGEQIFKTQGPTELMKAIKADLVSEEAYLRLGSRNVKKLPNNNFQFNNKKVEMNAQDTLFDLELGKHPMYRTYGDSKVLQEAQELPKEDVLKGQLLNLLNKLGVRTMGITDYLEKFNIKNGVDPSAQALADIANRIVAFQGGEISTADLTEETSHFIVEGWDISQIENLLRNIHKSEEWAEFSDQYRQTYSEKYSGEELEQVVRKEILGKMLANAIQGHFSLENKTETQKNFLEKLKQLFQDFFLKVQSVFKPQYAQDLQKFNTQVIQMLQHEDSQSHLSDKQISGSKLTLYSLSPNSGDNMAILQATAKQAVNLLEITQTQMSKLKGMSSNKEALNRIKLNLEAIDENNKVATFAGITASVKTQLKYLEQAFNNNSKNMHPFASEENIVYLTLINQMQPLLGEISSLLDQKRADDRLIKSEINDVVIGINDLRGKVGATDTNQALEFMVEELAIKHNWNDNTKAEYLATLKAAKKDTNWAHAYFGGLAHAQNPILNMFGNIIKRITMQTSVDHRNATTDFMNEIQKLGIDQSTLNTLKKGSHLIDATNWGMVEETINTIEMEAYNKFSGKEALSLKEYLRQKREMVLPELEAAAYTSYRQEVRAELDPYLEKPFNDTYYARKKALYAEKTSSNPGGLGISEDTQRWIATISGDVASVYNRAKDANGLIVLTEALKFDLEQISKERAFAKSPFGNDGKYKEGLKGVLNSEGKLEIVLDGSDLSPEALRAYELEKLDKNFMEELNKKLEAEKKAGINKKGIPPQFLEEIKKLEDKGDFKGAVDYLKLNSYIGFEKSFWDNLNASESLVKRLQEVTGEDSQRAAMVAEDIKEVQAKRNNILKANRVLNQPSETDVERMSTSEKENVKEYSESLQDLYQEASKFFKKKEAEEIEEMTTSENTPNQAYQDALKVNGVEGTEIIEFIKKNSSVSNKLAIEKAVGDAENLIKGRIEEMPKKYAKYFTKDYNSIENEVNREVAIRKDLLKFAESKLLPYYTRFAPAGYENLMQEMENGTKKVSTLLQEIIEERSPITVTPNYSFFEVQQNADINDNFQKNFAGGRLQFKEQAEGKDFRDKDFENMFGVRNGVATRNQKLFAAREVLLKYHKDSLEALGETGSHNLYKLPQQSKGSLKKLKAFTTEPSFGKVKESLKDSFGYREEDIASGEVIKGDSSAGVEDMRTIPKYGMRELANQEDLSDELLTSYSWMHEQAVLHRARKENIGYAFSLKEAVLNSDYGGKSAQATATYKMFSSYMDENFFGIKESYEKDIPIYKGYSVHLSKILRMFGSFVRFRNLGFALVSPITSLITAKSQFWLENMVGEHVHSDSTKLARKEFRKLAGASISETLEFNSQSRLNVIGEHFMVFEGDRRLANSSFNQYARGLVKTPFATHSMANFPVIPTVMLSVLYDYRVVNGQVQNYNEYKTNNKGLTALELKNTWSAAAGDAMYKFMDVKDGKFSYDMARLEPLLNKTGEELEKYVSLKNEAIFQRVSLVSQAIDGNISPEEKSMASRNLVLQLFLTHRNFLSLWTQKRFKGTHMSLETGQVESGSYATLGRFIKGYSEQFQKGDVKDIVKNMKEYWEGLSDNEKMNMQRNGKDFVMLNALLAVVVLLANVADDPDKEDWWALQAGNYLMLRLANETASTSYAIPLSYYDTVDDLFVGLNSIPEVLAVGDIGSDETVKSGKWAGFTKNQRYIGRNTGIAKQYAEIVNTTKVKDQYLLNNGAFMNFVPLTWVTGKGGEE